jgi:hypothetical protein
MTRRFILIVALISISLCAFSIAAAADAWWPERAQFKPSGGAYREKLSPANTYVYDASDAKVIVPADPNLPPDAPQALDAKVDKLADGAELAPIPNTNQAAWTLGKIEAGKYWLGIQVYSGDKAQPDAAQGNWHYITRVNGMGFDFTGMTAPVEVATDRYAAEIQSAAAIELKAGDRITVKGNWDRACVGKLMLYKNQPKRGPIFHNPGHLTSGRLEIWDSQIGFNVKQAGQKGEADYYIRNTANVTQELKVDIRVADYFGKTVATDTKTFTLKDLASQKVQVLFDTGDSPRYRATMTIRGLGGLMATTPPGSTPRWFRAGSRPPASTGSGSRWPCRRRWR